MLQIIGALIAPSTMIGGPSHKGDRVPDAVWQSSCRRPHEPSHSRAAGLSSLPASLTWEEIVLPNIPIERDYFEPHVGRIRQLSTSAPQMRAIELRGPLTNETPKARPIAR
jgi:hypothetical protein